MDIPVLLRQEYRTLRTLNPLDHRVAYKATHWGTRFSHDPHFAYIVQQHPGHISRGNLARLASVAAANVQPELITRLFLGAMMWGYGTVGYGPYRTHRMFTDPDFANVVAHSFTSIANGQVQQAYEQFQLPMCGPAFFTKYFYFVGLGYSLNPQPLILDTVIARKLEEQLDLDITAFASVIRGKDGHISAMSTNVTGYGRYITLLSAWARELDCRPDSIEVFLFTLE